MAEMLERTTTAVVVVNALAFTVGLVSPEAAESAEWVEHLALVYMVAELGIKMHHVGWHLGRFVRDPWNGFDVVLIALSLLATVPAAGALRITRAARLLKVLHIGRHAVQLRAVPRVVALART